MAIVQPAVNALPSKTGNLSESTQLSSNLSAQ